MLCMEAGGILRSCPASNCLRHLKQSTVVDRLQSVYRSALPGACSSTGLATSKQLSWWRACVFSSSRSFGTACCIGSRAGSVLRSDMASQLHDSYADEGDDVDVLGLGQAMVDFVACVDDSFLSAHGLEKGCRRLINVDERGRLLASLDGGSYEVTAGGSVVNTLVALSRLGAARQQLFGDAQLAVAMVGPLGCDPLGKFFEASMRKAHVKVLTNAPSDSSTGTVVVLTTPDAQRTFLSYLGSGQHLRVDQATLKVLSRTRVVVIEGYLFELPGILPQLLAVVAAAKAGGALVAVTCADAGVVSRHRSSFETVFEAGVDVVFSNHIEASTLLQLSPMEDSADQCALALGSYCPVAVVTDGANGARITGLGQLHVIPPVWLPEPPKDTNGAGDAFAAGFLFGVLSGCELGVSGRMGARVAAEVISRAGAALSDREAVKAVLSAAPAFRKQMATRISELQ